MKRTKQPKTKNKPKQKKLIPQADWRNIKQSNSFGTELFQVARERKARRRGRPVAFNSPEELLFECEQYFDWVNNNPLIEQRIAGMYYGEVVKSNVPKMRAMTIGGLCVFLGIVVDTWMNYRKQPDFFLICQEVEQTIREQKFAGAAAGFLNHAIIARDLGLVERQDVTSGDKPIERTVIVLPAKEAIEG
jgi:hypothetical protein